MFRSVIFSFFSLFFVHGIAVATPAPQQSSAPSLIETCVESLKPYEYGDEAKLKAACAKAAVLDSCKSVQGEAIFHYEKTGSSPDNNSMRILVFSLIHGDETHAGVVGRFWMERLESIQPNNHWRVIPVLNPDGVKAKSRVNANKVDLNRNFPTKDWDEKAVQAWEKSSHRNLRRFPGPSAGSEPETQCAVKHIEDFKPQFVVSIHTPLKVLDFDGPKLAPPKFDLLPWKSLGHFPGSLGRFLWHERSTPVLTMELAEKIPKDLRPFEQLQDIIGRLAAHERAGGKETNQVAQESDH